MKNSPTSKFVLLGGLLLLIGGGLLWSWTFLFTIYRIERQRLASSEPTALVAPPVEQRRLAPDSLEQIARLEEPQAGVTVEGSDETMPIASQEASTRVESRPLSAESPIELDEAGAGEDLAGQSAFLPARFSLDVPFTPQAPHANWGMPYQEACEEASVLMVNYFWQGKLLGQRINADLADQEILKVVDWQLGTLGYYEDTDAADTSRMLKQFFGRDNVRLVENPTVNDIKEEIAAGRPVIVPAAGRLLGNVYFTPPGPQYHMLVITGYTETEFITNDPGTKRGHGYRYRFGALMNAIHDWTGSKDTITEGRKVMIVVDG